MKRFGILFSLLLFLAPRLTLAQKTIPSNKVTIRSIVASGTLADLRWPNFSDHRASADNFYKPSYQLAWIRNGDPSPQALAVIEVFQHADEEGLNGEDYDGPRWPDRIKALQANRSSEDQARFDVALTVCAMRYVSDLRVGRVNPKHVNFGFDVGPKKLNLAQFLRDKLVKGEDVKGVMAGIEPPFAGYKRTRATLLHYMDLARSDDGQPLPFPDKTVGSGEAYAGIPRLTQLLVKFGDLPQDAISEVGEHVYKEPLVRALKNFQLRHGLPHDGRLNQETVDELNTPLSFRVEQLRLTLERWRWLPLAYAQPPVVVNLPEFFLRAYDAQGKPGLAMNVNVGEAYEHETPVFEQRMSYIVFRPYWDVPPSIQRNEIVPDIEADRDYIKDNNFEVISSEGKVVTGAISDSVLQQIRAGKFRVRQKPGPSNALGLVKFIFPNVFSVYLHDTPQEKEMFAETRRDLSHGCIHVQEPDQLAAWVLRNKPEWTLERVQHAMHNGPDNTRVNLTKPIPVLILYGTAVVEDDGEVFFYHDIYGHDAALEKALAKGYPYPR